MKTPRIITKLDKEPLKYQRVLEFIQQAGSESRVGSRTDITRCKRPQQRLELALVHAEIVGGDFFDHPLGDGGGLNPRLTRVWGRLKKVIPGGNIIGAYCDGTLRDW